MDDAPNSRRTKLFLQFIAVLFVLLGMIGFVVTAINWSSIALLSLVCTLAVNVLMLIGGWLLLRFRQGGLEIVFIILRLGILLGLGTVSSGVLANQFSTIIFGGSVLVMVTGLMIFLSRNNVKSLFGTKA